MPALRRLPLLLLSLVLVSPAKADWINLTGAETAPNIAEITVRSDGVSAVVEIFPSDARYFVDLLPDALFGADLPERPAEAIRLARFSREGLRVETLDGEVLPVRIVSIEPGTRKNRQSPLAGITNPQTGSKVPEAPKDKRVIRAELFYPFNEKPGRAGILPAPWGRRADRSNDRVCRLSTKPSSHRFPVLERVGKVDAGLG